MATENTSDTEMVDDDDLNPTTPTPTPTSTPSPTSTRSRPPVARDEDLPDEWPDEAKEELRRAREALKKTNRENAERRRRTEELERAEEERKNASLGETERLKKEAKEAAAKAAEAERRAAAAEARLVEEQIDAAVEREAGRLGFEYPEIACRLIDRSRVEKEEETGRIVGVREALERLIKDKPNLVQAAPRGGTPPRDGPRRGSNNNGNNNGSRETPEESFETHLRGTGKYSF